MKVEVYLKIFCSLLFINMATPSFAAKPVNGEHQRLMMLLQTKLTHLDTDGDGTLG